ncbi:2034_t:CDS:2, partial [Scutellospora calospora]
LSMNNTENDIEPGKDDNNDSTSSDSSQREKQLSYILTGDSDREKFFEEDVEILQFNELSNLDINEIDSAEDDDEEMDEPTIKILCNISDISSTLLLQKGNENKKDERIINALKPLELATRFFSGSKYPTLLIIYLTIRELQNRFKDFNSVEIDNEDYCDDKLDILDSESDDEFYSPDSVFYKHDTCSHTPPDLDKIEQEFKNAIFNSLNKYWYDFCEVSDNELKQEIPLSADTEIMQNLFFE